jgi:hypothetical protein
MAHDEPDQGVCEEWREENVRRAVDWLGWCRSDRKERAALQALFDYAQVLQASGAQFQVPADIADLVVVERHEGNSTTGFGAPTIVLGADREAEVKQMLDTGDIQAKHTLPRRLAA